MNLLAIMQSAAGNIRQAHLDRMKELGVDIRTIADLGLVAPPVGGACGRLRRSGLFEPCEGPAHILQPVLVEGRVIDIVAWRTLQPDYWGLLRGVAWCMGLDNIEVAHDLDEPLQMSATPLCWLKEGAAGICIVDWASPEIRELITVQAIKVSDPKIGDVLIKKLSTPVRLPKIIRMQAAHAA